MTTGEEMPEELGVDQEGSTARTEAPPSDPLRPPTVYACSRGMLHEGGGVKLICAHFSLALAWLRGEREKALVEAAHMNEFDAGQAALRGRERAPDDHWMVGLIETDNESAGFTDNLYYWIVRPMPVLAALPPDAE